MRGTGVIRREAVNFGGREEDKRQLSQKKSAILLLEVRLLQFIV